MEKTMAMERKERRERKEEQEQKGQTEEDPGKWLYAVFLKLDPLVESDQVAVLRNMAKKCARIRSHFNSGSGSKLATVNMVITIVARLFGQGDLE
ncbi:hypothetical protein BGX24_006742 [Mortierella sp. AD032]|nr:hypothetical protein BGX24_006742 [Mortierella sp. AD032]